MTPREAWALTRYVAACCPQQAIDEYTPEAWHDLLGDLDFGDCKLAAAAVGRRQPFVAPAEIRAEVRRVRGDRVARALPPAPPAEMADRPVEGRYAKAVLAAVRRIADGKQLTPEITGPLPGDPPAEWRQAREVMKEARVVPPDPQQIAREQAAESRRLRAEREARERAEGNQAS